MDTDMDTDGHQFPSELEAPVGCLDQARSLLLRTGSGQGRTTLIALSERAAGRGGGGGIRTQRRAASRSEVETVNGL